MVHDSRTIQLHGTRSFSGDPVEVLLGIDLDDVTLSADRIEISIRASLSTVTTLSRRKNRTNSDKKKSVTKSTGLIASNQKKVLPDTVRFKRFYIKNSLFK